MKLRLQVILMLLTILGIASFLSVWLKQTYNQEKKTLAIKVAAAFQNVVDELQVAKLKLDTIPGDSLRPKNIRLIKTDYSEELTLNLDKKRAFISTVNVIKKKLKDSVNTDSPFIRKIVINGDQTLVDHKTSEPSDVASTKDHLFRVLYGVDSLQDTLQITEINQALLKKMIVQNIKVPFTIIKVDSTYKTTDLDNAVTIGFAHPASYILKTGNQFPYLLKRISLPLLSSVLLLAITIISFLLLYRNLVRQKRLTEIKNEFIGNITHELKTPIATVAVAIEAMKNFDALQNPARTQEYLDISANELQRLSLLVDKVLSLSKFEKNEIEIKKENFDLVQLVREVMESMKLQFEKEQVIVSVQSTGTNFTIEADRRHISSVIYNLLDNALKYRKTDPKIDVHIIDHTAFVELRVTDNGIGIPAEYNKKIFEQFFRVPSGDTHNIKGYGLGLSYVNYIVASHHGVIDVESEPGKGSSFNVKLPFKETDVINYDNGRSIRKEN